MERILFNEFSGGENRGPEDHVAPNEASVLQQVTHTDGILRSCGGRVLTTPIGRPAIKGHKRVEVNGTNYTFASSDGFIYLDCGAVTPRLRPIMMSGVTQSQYTSYCAFGDSLYISQASNTRATASPMQRWSSYYITGTITTDGSTTVVGNGTTWNTTTIGLGDKLFWYDGTTWQGGSYTITEITNTTHIKVNGNITAGTTMPYIITRTHPAGIAPIDAWTGTTAITPAAGGHFAAGTYLTAIVLRNSRTGFYSNPVYITTTLTLNQKMTFGTYNVAPSTD